MIDRSDVPAGYAVQRERGVWIVALPSVLQHATSLVTSAGSLHAAASSAPGARAFTGRGAAFRLATPHGDWLVRHYRRGGLVARVLRDEYARIGVPRPLRELHASVSARARGVDTPEVVACSIHTAALWYRADIATRFIPDSIDLADASLRGAEGIEVTAAWQAAGALLARAFDAGVVHPDLNLRNLLVQRVEGRVKVWLLDLDRAGVQDRAVGDVARSRMLERLHRSRRKLETQHGARVNEDALRAFDDGLNTR